MKRVRFGRWRGRDGRPQGFTTYCFLFLSVDIVGNIDHSLSCVLLKDTIQRNGIKTHIVELTLL